MTNLPRLLPAPPAPLAQRPSGRMTITKAQMRHMARRWHVENPDFILGILIQVKAIRENDQEDRERALHFIKEATEIGMFSKADLSQYTIACLNAGGSIAVVPSFRDALVRFTDDTPDVMAQIMASTPIHYWTYLPEKVSPKKKMINKEDDDVWRL